MLYNIETKEIKNELSCLECPHFDKSLKKCKGLGIACFEFDPTTQTCIDPVTKLPFKANNDR